MVTAFYAIAFVACVVFIIVSAMPDRKGFAVCLNGKVLCVVEDEQTAIAMVQHLNAVGPLPASVVTKELS